MKLVKINLDAPNSTILDIAADIIKDGGIVIYPTDTAYAIGADLLNLKAIDKLNTAKERTEGKNYTAIVDSIEMARKFGNITKTEEKIITKLIINRL